MRVTTEHCGLIPVFPHSLIYLCVVYVSKVLWDTYCHNKFVLQEAYTRQLHCNYAHYADIVVVTVHVTVIAVTLCLGENKAN